MNIDFETEPIGVGKDGKNVFLRDIWPSSEEVAEVRVEGENVRQSLPTACLICDVETFALISQLDSSRFFGRWGCLVTFSVDGWPGTNADSGRRSWMFIEQGCRVHARD